MVNREDILDALKVRMNRILLAAEAALPASQFDAFRKIVLNECGKSGLEKDLQRMFENDKDRHG
jgi:hypothetical protein